jgi:outer membrane receptor protein involved in Fe transport
MKNKRNPMYFAIQTALTTGALIASGSVFAQDEDEDKVELERVVTTGTHIRATDLETAAPVFSIDREDIARTGLTNVGDLLRQIPAAGSSLNLTDNTGGNGAIQVDLRNLGSHRVLVMVNGKRWATSIAGSADFTTIPVAVIERIDVLKDGASAIYGSDAIAGVINIITRSDYEGVEVKAYYGQTAEGDGDGQAFNVSMGAASDRGSVFFDASYVKTDPIWAGDRGISAEPLFGTGNAQGSSGTPQGRFIIYDIDGNWQNDSTTPGSNGFNEPNDPDLIPWSSETPFNFAPDNYLLTPQERTAIYIQGKYQITDNVTISSEALYNRRESAQFLAPTPLFIGDWGGGYGASDTPIGIGGQNPYNPYGYDLTPGYSYSGGLWFLGRRMVEQGNREFKQTNDTYYYNLGLEGFLDVGTGWDWSVNYAFNQNDQLQVTDGLFHMDNVRYALSNECVTDVNCVPLNLFGGAGTITQDMLDYTTFTGHNNSQTKLLTYDAIISSELAELPAGPLGFAMGYEHRRHSGFTQPDALVVSGVTSGNAANPTKGSYLVDEFFAEFNVPLLSEVAGAEVLEMSVAARYSDYDNFGTNTSGKVGLRWKPFEDLLVRATYSEAFRAPSIFESFLGLRDSYPTITDPCNGGAAANPTLPGCAGIPSNYTQSNPQIRITQGGNVNLTPEEAESFTVGMVYEPSFAEGLVLTLDYYDVHLDNVITTVGASQIMNACAVSGTTLCNLMTRGSSGAITDILDVTTNADQLDVVGFDFVASYSLDTDYGLFGFNWDTSYTDEYTLSVQDFAATAAAGTPQFVDFNFFNSSGDGRGDVGSSLFRLKSNAGVNWSYGDWSVFYQARYIGDYEESCDPDFNDDILPELADTGFLWCQYGTSGTDVDGEVINPDGDLNRRHIGSVTYHDIQGQYHLADYDTTFTLGIQNLFDKTPPLSPTAFANSFNSSYYDGAGQRWYFSVSKRF